MDETDISDVFTRLICKLPGQTFHFVVATCTASPTPSASRYEISKLWDRNKYFPSLRRCSFHLEGGLVKQCQLRCLICKRMATLLDVGNGSIASHSIGVVFRTRGLLSWKGEDGKLGHYGGETNNVKERLERRGNERLND